MRKGGVAAWSIRHPVSTVMITLAAVVLGVFALGGLSIDLLPHLIYPGIRVRVLDPGVSAAIMEDKITRQLEEQLAITEDAIGVESVTTQGATSVDLDFSYGKDIDTALRDASTRLDRAKRFLPTTIDPPVIYKRDPSQIPVMEFVVNSPLRDRVELRTWTDDVFAKRFLNIEGVAAAEVGGGLVREILVLPDQRRLTGLGLSIADINEVIRRGNEDLPAGRLRAGAHEYTTRTAGRLNSVAAIAALAVPLPSGDSISLGEVAEVLDSHEEERIRIRYNGVPGVKMTIQKQPNANTVEVADQVDARLAWMRANSLVPQDINVDVVSDQAVYVRRALTNATAAAVSGGVLAMVVVYLFLGNVRGTLIIGTAIPISIMMTFVIMALGGLTLNIMTLGGLALGVGMLIDNTIVMLENIARHQQSGESGLQAGTEAAAEVNSAIVASTSTNLAAVLPFLFIGGLTGLLFRELIFTISAAIVASLIVAVTLVPTLAARMSGAAKGRMRAGVDRVVARAQDFYARVLEAVLRAPVVVIVIMIVALATLAVPTFTSNKQEFLPSLDDGRISISITVDPGSSIDAMDEVVRRLERLMWSQSSVESIYSLVGGRIFGRTERETGNQSTLSVQLVPLSQRKISSQAWIKKFMRVLSAQQIAGLRVRPRVAGIRGLRTGRSEDDVSVRVQGSDLGTLERLGEQIAKALRAAPGLRNVRNSAEEIWHELAAHIDRQRAAELGVEVTDVGQALRVALDGIVVSDFLDADRSYDIRVRLPQEEFDNPAALGGVLLFGERHGRPAVYLRDVARVELVPMPAEIRRESQRRIVDVTASLTDEFPLGEVMAEVREQLKSLELPPGYTLYTSGLDVSLERGRRLAWVLVGLALFLVYVVMAVQYESLRNPTVIMLSVPFTLIGVSLGLMATGLTISMPVWMGVIMLVGIVVNNAIVLVEYIEIMRERGRALHAAIVEAGRLRLRPILMTTITTVVGMLPLALALGEGAEMLQPLAVTIVAGLSFSMLISLVLVPAMYSLISSDSRGQRSSVAGPN
jgi:CzcA family heavy metal efflux pump